jgi:PKD repeat protein
LIKFRFLTRIVFGLLSIVGATLPVYGLIAHREKLEPPKLILMPAEVSSNHFTVTIGETQGPVMHAVSGYYLLNFELSGATRITITADDAHYWDAGVEVQPMRLGIRPHREGASITFPLTGPAKLCITRPNDHYADSEMLFLFANQPDASGITARTPGIRYYGAGIHRESIDAQSGDHIYLAAGAVIFGALNIWQVHDVHVSGLGTIIYDGPQDPKHDEGWMHKRNWHVIVMDNASNIDIEGITGIVRSRTWMVQMRDSHQIAFRNVKIIGGNAGNANQDGMDWLGGGDTLVQDSFIRASDDIFAMYGNWDGYSEEALTTPGHEVGNITIENSVLSTSISNVVRMGWPRKIFDSHDFTLRNSDVLHTGAGGCGVPFALFEIWADPGGKGHHSGIRLEDIRLEDWYSLVNIRQPNPDINDVAFTNITAMDGPGMVPSVLKGDVAGVAFKGVNLGSGEVLSNKALPIEVLDGAENPHYERGPVEASFTYSPGVLRPGASVAFTAAGKPGLRYRWLFGDGDSAEGQAVRHAFPDGEGTLMDGTGRFRVLLSVRDDAGRESWSSQLVVVSAALHPAAIPANPAALALGWAATGDHPRSYQGYLNVPADGGYTLTLLTSASASMTLDDVQVDSAKLRPQVCGSAGNAVQAVRLSGSLGRGLHRVRIDRGPEIENAAHFNGPSDLPVLLWEGSGIARQEVPDSSLLHATE